MIRDRLKRFVASAVIDGVIEFAESKEGQAYLCDVADDLVDRELARIQGSIGGQSKGSGDGDFDFSKAGLLKMFTQRLMSGGQTSTQPLNIPARKLTID